jgi:hypothetical protein
MNQQQPPVVVPPVEPIWTRLPPPGRRHELCSLSRSAINNLILGPSPVVKSIHPPGAGRLVLWLGAGGLKEYLANQLCAVARSA